MADVVFLDAPHLAFSPGAVVFLSMFSVLGLGLVLGDNELQRCGWLEGWV